MNNAWKARYSNGAEQAERLSNQEVRYFGMRYVVPLVEERPRTILAVNLGGPVIPVLLASYLVVKNGLYGRALLATLIVAPGLAVGEPIRAGDAPLAASRSSSRTPKRPEVNPI